MPVRRWLVLVLVAFGLILGAPQLAAAKDAPKKSAKRSPKKAKKAQKYRLVCKGTGKARKCKRVANRGKIVSRGVPLSELRDAPLARPSGWVHVVVPGLDNTELKVNIYNEDGSYNQEALAQLDALWQCKKTHETRAVDPRLYEVLSTLYDHYGQRIELLSGFRYQQNEGSRHFHASAMDLRIPGVSYKELYKFAQELDPGGMGIGEYPRMGFVHIDFRAPGEKSVRWTDTSGSVDKSDTGKRPSKAWVPGGKKPSS